MTPFSLRPYEDLVPGVRYRAGQLRLRPTWAATALDLYAIGFGVMLTTFGVVTTNLIGLIGGPLLVILCAPYLRCRVVAADRTIVVVNKWQRTTLAVDSVRTVVLENTEPSWFMPFRDPLTIWPRTLAAGVVVLEDGGRFRCDALMGLPRSSTDLDDTPIEVKTDILTRWVQAARGEPDP